MSQTAIKWHNLSASTTLAPKDVHLWYIRLDQSQISKEVASNFLSRKEKVKAKQFSSVEQKQYIIKRCAIRGILSRYIGISTQDIQFKYGPNGKPCIGARVGGERLTFNVSYSHNLCLIAVTKSGDVGIDIEYLHSRFSLIPLMNHFFSESEIHKITVLPQEY